jgi:nickel transport protein
MNAKTTASRLLPVLLIATALTTPAVAHNLVMEAYAVSGGKSIEGDAFFSDGTLAKNATIIVTDDSGKVIQQVITDDKGNFAYVPAQPVTQHLKLDLGSGHVANVVIASAKLAGGTTGAPATTVAAAPAAAPFAGGGIDAASQDKIAQMVAAEIGPLNDEVELYRSHNDLMNILASIGLLCGFGGVLLFSAGAALVKSTSAASGGAGSARRAVRT